MSRLYRKVGHICTRQYERGREGERERERVCVCERERERERERESEREILWTIKKRRKASKYNALSGNTASGRSGPSI